MSHAHQQSKEELQQLQRDTANIAQLIKKSKEIPVTINSND